MLTAGVDVGTSGVRAVVLDTTTGRVVARADLKIPPGTRTPDGGHVIDESPVVAAALQVLTRACGQSPEPPVAISVAGTAGTLCFRDANNVACAAAVMYDDARSGTGIERVIAWQKQIRNAVRVLPITDAVLEALGATAGVTDWTNARRLGWDAQRLCWPEQARGLEESGFVPSAEPPSAPAGPCTLPGARGALLTRGATDSCAMHIGVAGFAASAWSVSLGTTVTWKAALTGLTPTAIDRLPAGAYAHRLADHFWLAAAAGNSGGGALIDLDLPGANLSELDRRARFPSGFAAYPLPRRGERFPVANLAFAGFGVPHRADPRRHPALLEGVAFVIRLGIERIAKAGVGPPMQLYVTGGGAASAVWTRLLASVMQIPAVPQLDAAPAVGAAVLAAAGAGEAAAPDGSQQWVVPPDWELAAVLDERYAAFLDCVSRVTPAAI